MADNTPAHALAGLVTVRRQTSLAHTPTCLVALSLRLSLAQALTSLSAAQSLRDGPKAARLCRRGAACKAKGLTGFRWMSNNTFQWSARSKLLNVLSMPLARPLNVSVRHM